MPGLDINQLLRPSAAKIFCALSVRMLIKAADNIVGDACVKRIVAAKDNVDLPIHAIYTTVPNTEPTVAVKPIASAPQKATRKAPLTIPAPPL